MRSDFAEEQQQRSGSSSNTTATAAGTAGNNGIGGHHQPTGQQFVENIGQSVANELFGYATGNGGDCAALALTEDMVLDAHRPKRKTRKMQQVCVCVGMRDAHR